MIKMNKDGFNVMIVRNGYSIVIIIEPHKL